MQNLENLDVFEILITQKPLKCLKDPFLRSALIYNFNPCLAEPGFILFENTVIKIYLLLPKIYDQDLHYFPLIENSLHAYNWYAAVKQGIILAKNYSWPCNSHISYLYLCLVYICHGRHTIFPTIFSAL